MSYTAPVDRISFSLKHEAGFDRLFDVIPELDADLISSILEEAGKFTTEVIAPTNRIGDEEKAHLEAQGVIVPDAFKDAYKQLVDNGWPTLSASEKYGGQGLPISLANAVFEMLNSNIAFTLCQMLTSGAVEALEAHASEEQKDKYLHQIISGNWSATMNLTEPQAGSDVGAVKTKAEPQPDGSYKIYGTKIYITYGDHNMTENIIHLVLARTPDAPEGTKGISLFIVPKFFVNDDGSLGDRNDVKCIGLEDKLGIHASPTCVMSFGENDGATGWLIGAENTGMAAMFTMMNNARLNVGIQGVGLAEQATQIAMSYAADREQGRAPDAQRGDNTPVAIASHPDVRNMLMTMRALTDAARAICYENGVFHDLAHFGGDDKAKAFNELLTPISKAFSTDIANEVSSLGVQIHGGMGFVEETGIAQFARDAKILPIYEGTNGIQAIDLINRKLPLANGAIISEYLDQIEETVIQCAAEETLKELSSALKNGLADLRAATDFMMTHPDKLDRLYGATDYLTLFGLVAGGHYLARGALGTMKTNEMTHKVKTASFFMNRLLPRTKGHLASILSTKEHLDNEEIFHIVG
jgi:alkylation response protein AidB-like acyl-CoA dehydrogenase